MPAWVFGLEVIVGFVVPLIAAFVPIWRGVRITVHQAIRDTGVPETFGRRRIDRLLGAIRGLPRPALLSLRNTFRRKGRLVLTLSALALGGAVFMSVFTVRDSLLTSMADSFRYFNYDLQVDLGETVRFESAIAEAERVPGVASAEAWQFASALRDPAGRLRDDVTVDVRPAARHPDGAAHPRRGALAAARRGALAGGHAQPAHHEPGSAGRRRGDAAHSRAGQPWTLVGIVQSPSMEPFLYVSDQSLGEVTGQPGRASVLTIEVMTPGDLRGRSRGGRPHAPGGGRHQCVRHDDEREHRGHDQTLFEPWC